MKLKTTLVASVEEDGVYFDYLRMSMEDDGLRIQAKSPLVGKFIQSLNTPPTPWLIKKNNPWVKGTYWNIGDSLRGVQGYFYPEDYGYFHDGSPHLLWLCHTGLAEGFDLVVKQTISLNNFEDYFAKGCDAVRDLYTTYLRKATLEATFSELWGKK